VTAGLVAASLHHCVTAFQALSKNGQT